MTYTKEVKRKSKKDSNKKKKDWQNKKPKKKPAPARNNVKYPALDPNYNPKIRKETIDADYLNKLSTEELAFYNKFMEEYNNASFNHTKKDLHKRKKQKREIYNKNNARNRCIYSRAKAVGRLLFTDELFQDEVVMNIDGFSTTVSSKEDIENALVDYLDNKNKESKT